MSRKWAFGHDGSKREAAVPLAEDHNQKSRLGSALISKDRDVRRASSLSDGVQGGIDSLGGEGS